MAHFAELDENNLVKRVLVVSNDVVNNEPFPQSEPIGVAFCHSLYGVDTRWAQTSYNGSFRYNYAGVGYTFDPAAGEYGAFISPRPGQDYTLDTDTYTWIPPVQSTQPVGPPTVV